MYELIFISIFVFLLVIKTYRFRKNKRKNGSYEDLEEEFVIRLTEGDTLG
ncbi:hypothetical protein [Neobacillus cucumis]|nr:hypothetical protein [Neobacillus cucumis]MBM7654759.1 hypothetical protein [Neobacillus cucumis]